MAIFERYAVSLDKNVYLSYKIRDETIWRYIDTISIRRATIPIAAQRDISRYDPDIRNQGKSPLADPGGGGGGAPGARPPNGRGPMFFFMSKTPNFLNFFFARFLCDSF